MIDPKPETMPAGRVLLVEDDAIVAEIYRLVLRRRGFEVEIAGDGEAGLKLATDGLPDVVFLDIRLPKMDGIEMLRRMKANPATREIPVVMLSNYDDPELMTSSRALGAKQYLIKVNTDPTELPALAARCIAESQL